VTVDRGIAIFDSGVGGLTVMREIAQRLPAEDLVYFGDTARVPYGTKSQRTIMRFAEENALFLLRFQPKMLVVACNTASAAAIGHLRGRLEIPVIGVIEPGAAEAAGATRNRRVAVLATETTVRSEAYVRHIHETDPSIAVFQQACPLFVPIVEEGRTDDDPIVKAVVAEYLRSIEANDPDVVVLGCTHYPLIRGAIEREVGAGVRVVDSAHAAAREVSRVLDALGAAASGGTGERYYLASDNPERFAQIGTRFMGEPIERVHYVGPEDLAKRTGTFEWLTGSSSPS
jgi:glutamate racemase